MNARPSFEYLDLLRNCEDLAFFLEMLGLPTEALVQYDELEAMFSQFIINSIYEPVWFKTYEQPCNRFIAINLEKRKLNQIRQKIIDGSVCLLDFRTYLLERLCSLLNTAKKPWETAERLMPERLLTEKELEILNSGWIFGVLGTHLWLRSSQYLLYECLVCYQVILHPQSKVVLLSAGMEHYTDKPIQEPDSTNIVTSPARRLKMCEKDALIDNSGGAAMENAHLPMRLVLENKQDEILNCASVACDTKGKPVRRTNSARRKVSVTNRTDSTNCVSASNVALKPGVNIIELEKKATRVGFWTFKQASFQLKLFELLSESFPETVGLEITTKTSSTLIQSPKNEIGITKSIQVSYLWEVQVKQLKSEIEHPIIQVEFVIQYCESNLQAKNRNFHCTFDVMDYTTLFKIQAKIEPSELCRVRSVCHLHLTITKVNDNPHSELMHEVLADQNYWAICGIRLSKYVSAGQKGDSPQLLPFQPGQIYNSTISLQVHVLASNPVD
uniref:CSON007870 protein n=1 Tax=Culicoides sonorensis TaxID=179676 RepID=A0A336N6V7_CULSO